MIIPDDLAPFVALGVLAVVFAVAGLFARFRGRRLVVAEAIVERGAGPLGVLAVRWGGDAFRKYSGSAMYVGPWRGAGERVTIRYPEGVPERVEIVGALTRGVYLFVLAGLAAVAALIGAGVVLLTR